MLTKRTPIIINNYLSLYNQFNKASVKGSTWNVLYKKAARYLRHQICYNLYEKVDNYLRYSNYG